LAGVAILAKIEKETVLTVGCNAKTVGPIELKLQILQPQLAHKLILN
jgi:hypothetical protein